MERKLIESFSDQDVWRNANRRIQMTSKLSAIENWDFRRFLIPLLPFSSKTGPVDEMSFYTHAIKEV